MNVPIKRATNGIGRHVQNDRRASWRAGPPDAARIVRLAFGTFLGVPEPDTLWKDRDYAHGRWRAPHVVAFGARRDGQLAGANLARQEAYEALAARGYRTAIQGVYMHRNNEPGYCRPGVYVIDDWR